MINKKLIAAIILAVAAQASGEIYTYSEPATGGGTTDDIARSDLADIKAKAGDIIPAGDKRFIAGDIWENPTGANITVPADTTDAGLTGADLQKATSVQVDDNVMSTVDLVGVAPVGAETGINTVTGKEFYVVAGNWLTKAIKVPSIEYQPIIDTTDVVLSKADISANGNKYGRLANPAKDVTISYSFDALDVGAYLKFWNQSGTNGKVKVTLKEQIKYKGISDTSIQFGTGGITLYKIAVDKWVVAETHLGTSPEVKSDSVFVNKQSFTSQDNITGRKTIFISSTDGGFFKLVDSSVRVPSTSDYCGLLIAHPNGSLWERVFSGGVRGVWFTGSLAGDHSSQLNKAIAQAERQVIIDQSHLITGLVIKDKVGFTVSGKGILTLNNAGSSGKVFDLQGTISGLTISGLTMIGENNTEYHQAGIGNSSGQTISDVVFTHNSISKINVGISANANLGGSYVNALIAYNNLKDIVGTESGQGYGIHLAKAFNVRVVGNTIDNASRHSIYQASGYGVGNVITLNMIINHRKDVRSHKIRSAITVLRSSGVMISANTIKDYWDGGMTIAHDSSDSAGASDIQVTLNTFINRRNNVSSVYIGEQAIPTINKVSDIEIENNTFMSRIDTVVASEITILNGLNIKFRRNTFNILNKLGRFISLGHDLYLDDVSQIGDIDISKNEFGGDGMSANARGVYVTSKVCGSLGNTARILLEDNTITQGAAYFLPAPHKNKGLILSNAGTKTGVSAKGETSISVKDMNRIRVFNDAATTITSITNGIEGQTLVLYFSDANTTLENNGSIKLRGGVDYTSDFNSIIILTYQFGKWFEKGRM